VTAKKNVNAYWMVCDPQGLFSLWGARYQRNLCISDFVRDCQAAYRDPPYTPTWEDLRREGYRCARVEVREVKP
jgi:hypothetical protein